MATNKTVENEQSVSAFLNKIDNAVKKEDSLELLQLMQDLTGKAPKMWGSSIVGFGSYHYKYESGREGDMPRLSFSPRKTALTLYIMNGFDKYDSLLAQLGKHKTGKACLYIKKLADINKDVLKEMLTLSLAYMAEKYPE